MATATYTGSLQTKKKAELQELASALDLTDNGTREELVQRIKKHLDANARELEEDPVFAGLFGGRRRGRSLQPASAQSNEGSTSLSANASAKSALNAIKELKEDSPPEMRDVSMMLPSANGRGPVSPSPNASPRRRLRSSMGGMPTPSSLPPLPPSPASPAKRIIADAMAQPEVQAVVAMERNVMQSVWVGVERVRVLLSNAQTIFILSAIFDFFAILATIHQDAPYPLPPITLSAEAAPTLRMMAIASGHWAIPSVILPLIVGYFVSFGRVNANGGRGGGFDPLTASIVRVVGSLVYPYPSVPLLGVGVTETYTAAGGLRGGMGGGEMELHGTDVLGVKWRVVNAGMGLAFAFAEAIGRAGLAQAQVQVQTRDSEGVQGVEGSAPQTPIPQSARRRKAIEG